MGRWRDVVGYEGIYQVSDQGRVKRIAAASGTFVGKILRLTKAHGYCHVGLCLNRKRTTHKAHRLVLDAFVGPEPDLECNHKNGIRDDNRLENLEWVTPSENMRHSLDVLGNENARGERQGMSKLTAEQVRTIRVLYASGQYTYQELGKFFAVGKSTIWLVVRRVTWQHVI